MGAGGAPADAGDRLDSEDGGGGPPLTSLPGLRQLAGRSVLYSFGGLAQKAVGIILVPLLARALSTSEFGRLEVLSAASTSLTSIGILGLDIVVTRRWAEADTEQRRSSFSTWLAIEAAIGATLVLAALLGAGALDRIAFDGAEISTAIRLTAAVALVNLIHVVALTALRNQDRSRTYATVAAGTALLNGVLVVALVQARRDEASVVLGGALAIGIAAAVALALTRSVTLGAPRRAEASLLLITTLPLVPGLVLAWGSELATRFVLLGAAGATEVGYLSIAIRFAAIGLLVVSGVQLAWHPRAYAMAGRAGASLRLASDARALLAIVTLLAVVMAAVGPELLRLIAGDRYAGALPAVGWALLVPVGAAALLIVTLPFVMANRMGPLGIATAVAAIVTVALTIALSDRFGAAGATAAMAAGQLAGSAHAVWTTRRRGFETYVSPMAGLLPILSFAIVLAITLPRPPPDGLVRAGAALAFLLVFAIAERRLVRTTTRWIAQRFRRAADTSDT